MLTWKKIDNYYLRSECGQWHIAKVIVCGVVRFELRQSVTCKGTDVWSRAKAMVGENHGHFLTTAEARAKAEEMNVETRRAA